MSLRLGALTAMSLLGVAVFAQFPIGGIRVSNGSYQGYSPYQRFSPYEVYAPRRRPVFRGGGTTIAESQLRGMADLVRATGYQNLLNSEAAINAEQARSAQLDNRLKYAETYYEKRRIRDAAMAEDRSKLTYERAHRLADLARPKRLTKEEYDPETGKISWPLGLRGAMMNGTRKRIEQLFHQRDVSGSLDADTYYEIVRLCEFLDQQIGAELDNIPIQDVSQGKSFIKRLAYEARVIAG